MVTAELAAALPALALVMVMAIWVIGLTSVQLRCSDAAREAARAAARGEDMSTVREIAEAVAPDEAQIDIAHADGLVTIEVRATLEAPPPFGTTLSPTVSGKAIALEERP
ncbi:TadE family type IV pilus minor pilin [Phytoactinopolyspora endophytica]|uniref:TadE family type IV pilus minor pilin n=1 Tax=Phytoactinopolyspora endophytica TaxID=1642495 RepID=UPI00101D3918|nr:TadE family type IV pilus minor pilin [Phytoactinopolyspora endophytica]